MICWSCEKSIRGSDGMFCGGCGAIQPPDPGADHFAMLGVPRAFAVDVAELERRYKDLARQAHPDRFARSDARARRASLLRTVRLNEAWKTLRDPVARAEYLLSLAGIDVGTEDGTQRRQADGSKQRVPVPQALLMEIMELREALMEARMAEDEGRVAELADEVRGRKRAAMAMVAAALSTPAAPAGMDLDVAARELVSVRYFDRFLDEVDAHDDARAEATASSAGGAGHGS